MPTTTTSAVRQLSDGNGLNGGPGTVLGLSATDLIGFFGLNQGVAQPGATGNAHVVNAGTTNAVFTNTTFDGGTGSTAYTLGDVVLAMKKLGLIAS